MLDKEYFTTQIKTLTDYINRRFSQSNIKITSVDRDFYYSKFSYMDNLRFAKVIKWLYENWRYKHFPLIGDFNMAKEQTSEGLPGNYISPKPEDEKRNAGVAYFKHMMKIINRDIKIMKILEFKIYKEQTGNFTSDETPRAQTLKFYIPFMKEMFEKNMAYHIKNKEWVKSTPETRREEYFIPACNYPPNHKFIF